MFILTFVFEYHNLNLSLPPLYLPNITSFVFSIKFIILYSENFYYLESIGVLGDLILAIKNNIYTN